MVSHREASEGISPRARSSSSSSPSPRFNSIIADLHSLTGPPSMPISYLPPRSNSVNCTYAEDMLLTMASSNSNQWTDGSFQKETMDSYSTEKSGPSYVLEAGPSTVPYDAKEESQTESPSAQNGSSVSYCSYLITSDSSVFIKSFQISWCPQFSALNK